MKKVIMMVFFGLLLSFAVYAQSGEYQSVAINNNGAVIEVHAATSSDQLWYNIGYIDPSQNQLHWIHNGTVKDADAASDAWTRVSVNGDHIVVLYPGEGGGDVWCATGDIQYSSFGYSDTYQKSYEYVPKSIKWTNNFCIKSFPSDFSGPVDIQSNSADRFTFFYISREYYYTMDGGSWADLSKGIQPTAPDGGSYIGSSTKGFEIAGESGNNYFATKNSGNGTYTTYSGNYGESPDNKTITEPIGQTNTHYETKIFDRSPNGNYFVSVSPVYEESLEQKIAEKASEQAGLKLRCSGAISSLMCLAYQIAGNNEKIDAFYQTGQSSPHTKYLSGGEYPTVAVNDYGQAVEVHNSSTAGDWSLWAETGYFNGNSYFSQDGTMTWSSPHEL